MNRYVVITDDPGRVRSRYGRAQDWTQRRFDSAAEALAWERSLEAVGCVALESQGWAWGVTFVNETALLEPARGLVA